MREKKEKRGAKGSRPRIEYRYPYLTEDALAPIYAAYSALTGRGVYKGVRNYLVLNARVHGHDLIPLMTDLHAQYGVDDLLKRLLHHPPRQVLSAPQPATAESAQRVDPENGSSSPDEVRFTSEQEIAWRVAEMRSQRDDGLRPREWRVRLDQVPTDPGECPSCGERRDGEPGGWCDLCKQAGRIVTGHP